MATRWSGYRKVCTSSTHYHDENSEIRYFPLSYRENQTITSLQQIIFDTLVSFIENHIDFSWLTPISEKNTELPQPLNTQNRS
jgi:hypothetical protein